MKVKFFKRGEFIHAKITNSRECVRVSTGIKAPEHLEFNGQFLGDSIEAVKLNDELSKFRVKSYESYSDGHDSTDLLTLANTYKTLIRRDIITKDGKPLSKSTKKLYSYAASMLIEFGQPFELQGINQDQSLQKKKEVSNNFDKYFKRFEEFLHDRSLTIKTRASVMSCISVMLNYWSKELFIPLPKLNYSKSKENPIVVLDEVVVGKVLREDREMSPELRYTWEVCCMILLTSMRIDDAINVRSSDLSVSESIVYVNKENKKTGSITNAPLPAGFSKVLIDNMNKNGQPYSLEPSIYVVYDNIKTLFSMYDEMHDLVSIKKYGVDGLEVSTKPFYEHVHPHMLRKTAITSMLLNGVSERHVKFLSCHKSSSFERYVAFVEKKFNSEVVNYHKAMNV